MGAHDELERRIVVAEGILDPDEAGALTAEAARVGQGLLARLRGTGRISEATFASLRLRVDELGQPTTGSAVAATPPSVDAALAATVHGGTPRSPTRATGHEPPDAPDGRGADGDPDVFPVPSWDRYEPIRLLGKGGMGLVFLARDLRLHRNVAIKFVRGDDPELTRRIVAEARAQAKVNDDRVCKVYDVGEIRGRVYIAMQAIDGRTLSELRGELGYEQQAMVMRGAALGVHEAHKVGLVHRDLKPSNIMVERADDGELRPFVMDFGVARDWTDSATMTGTVLGTPHYMAPEQARGEIKQLDRRADVYSLGATLYALLVGRPPITGDNPLLVLNRISVDEAPRPRTLDPDVPADLEAIVMKCLEKERAARYDSARALADDLGRFLGGEPVVARAAAGLGYRLRKFVRRRWRLVAAAAVVLAIVGVALGFGLRERWQAARRETIARRFTEQVERIESLAIRSALSPAHDVRNDRATIEAEMDEIARAMRAEGSAAQAAGHYALGRGHLALGDDERAEQQLARAWHGGFRDPRAAFALAVARGHLYQRGLGDAMRRPADERAGLRAALIRTLRDPALALLRTVEGDDAAPAAYLAALVAFYEDRHDDALRRLDQLDLTAGGMSSFYQAPLLRGQILHARAIVRSDAGEAEQATADLDAGRRALAAAAAIADSEPSVHQALAELEWTDLAINLYASGAIDGPFERGMAAARRTLAIWPEHHDARLFRSMFQRSVAMHRGRRGDDVTTLLTAALADGERLVALARTGRERREARFELTEIYRGWGEVLQNQHADPGPKLERALALASEVAPGDRDAAAWAQLGVIHTHWADHLDEVGGPSTPHRDAAIAAYQQATALDDRLSDAWLNLSRARFARARRAQGAAADTYLDGALQALARGTQLDASNLAALAYQAEVHALVADRQEARDADPGPGRRAAIAAYEQGQRASPDQPLLPNAISIEQVKQARTAWHRGQDPDPSLTQARAAVARAIALAPNDPNGHNNLGDAWLQQASHDRERGRDPRPAARAALDGFERALELIPDYPLLLLNVASVHVVVAAYGLDLGQDPRPVLARAKVALDRASRQQHDAAEELRVRGAVAALEARWLTRQRLAADRLFDEAVRAYRDAIARAVTLGPELPMAQGLELELGQVLLAWAQADGATHAEAPTPITDGLVVAERLLGSRPSWAAVRALHGGLLLARAQRAATPADARRDATTAATELQDALAANPNLATRWGPDLALARRLAAAPGG